MSGEGGWDIRRVAIFNLISAAKTVPCKSTSRHNAHHSCEYTTRISKFPCGIYHNPTVLQSLRNSTKQLAHEERYWDSREKSDAWVRTFLALILFDITGPSADVLSGNVYVHKVMLLLIVNSVRWSLFTRINPPHRCFVEVPYRRYTIPPRHQTKSAGHGNSFDHSLLFRADGLGLTQPSRQLLACERWRTGLVCVVR